MDLDSDARSDLHSLSGVMLADEVVEYEQLLGAGSSSFSFSYNTPNPETSN